MSVKGRSFCQNYKVTAIVALLFLVLALYIIESTPPASKYEISIYDAYPPYFWLFIIVSVGCGIWLLILQAFSQSSVNSLRVSLTIIFLTNLIVLLLPLFRGYAIYGRGDTLSHIGYMRDLITMGHINSNFYPIIHIIGIELKDILAIPYGGTVIFLYSLFYILWIINIFLLASVVAEHRSQVLLIVAFSSPLVFKAFHLKIHPSFLALFMLPLILYFAHKLKKFKDNRVENTIALVILAFLVTFAHPIVALYVIVVLLVFDFSEFLNGRFIETRGSSASSQIRSKRFTGTSLIVLVTFFAWYLSFAYIEHSMRTVYNWLIHQNIPTLFQHQLASLAEANLSIFQTIRLFMIRYGSIAIFFFVSVLAILLTMRIMLKKGQAVSRNIFNYSLQFIVASIIGAAEMFGFFVEYNPVRTFRLMLVMSVVLCGLTFYSLPVEYFSKYRGELLLKKYRKVKFFIFVIIISIFLLNLFSVYHSPLSSEPNHHVTYGEVRGMQWFLEHQVLKYQNKNVEISRNRFQVWRFGDLLLGRETPYFERDWWNPYATPPHFRYGNNATFAEFFEFKRMYIIMCELDRVVNKFYPKNVWPKVSYFTNEDFGRINTDPTVNKIYTDTAFEVWSVLL